MQTVISERWSQPQPVDGLDLAFGGKMSELLPPYSEIPEEFKRHTGKWQDVVSTWFFRGLPDDTVYTAKEGIDCNLALRHVGAILRSFEPKHEHKTAGCAWLLSLWFDDIAVPKKV